MSAWKRTVLVLALGLAVLGGPLAAAGPVIINLSTFAPANSAWHKDLLDMGNTWKQATDGRVTLNVYAGGTQGTESSVVKMMRPGVDHLQAALLLLPGLSQIDESLNVFGMPFFFQSDAEMEDVLQKLEPVLTKRLEAKGFHVLFWGSAGWVQVFSKKAIRTLDDLKHSKLYTTEGDDRMVQWYKSNGFNPVALNLNDIPAQLKLRTGMIDAVPSPPQGALLLQFFRDAIYMLDLHVAPLIGGCVITDKAWNAISPDDRAKMMQAAQAMEKRVLTDAPKVDSDSVDAMTKRGLTVTKLDPAAAAEFRTAAEKLVTSMRGNMVPADIYDMALQERDAYRKTHK